MEVNGKTVEMKFGEHSLEQLTELHNEMCLTAKDFGLTAEPVPSFENVQVAVAACERLHTQIKKARERAAAPPKKERRKAAAKAKKTAEKSTAGAVQAIAKASGAVVAGYTEPTKEKSVAKKAKKAKSAVKKVAAKKANGGKPRAGKYPLDAKVTWIAKENPGRKGSIFFDRMEKVRKATTGGKLVEAILKGGIPSGEIRVAADKELVRVTGGTARA